MIVVTGGAGFIGSNIVRALNRRGRDDILVVDNLRQGAKFRNLVDCEILDLLDKEEFIADLPAALAGPVDAVFHQGACSSTLEDDGRYVMRNNYGYSKRLLHHCLDHGVPFIYASSAAVYGGGTAFAETRANEAPLNVYGYSKFLFDCYVRRLLPAAASQVAGLRYFNVYGPREAHKGGMASVASRLFRQVTRGDDLELFAGSDGCADGEQRRDFVHVDDAVRVNLWFLDHPEKSGIYNAGTGQARSFNDLAGAVIHWHGGGRVRYIPFPERLRGRYQDHTEADLSALRAAGYGEPFLPLEEGIPRYMDWLAAAAGGRA